MSQRDTDLQALLAQVDSSPDRVLAITPALVRSWVQEIIDLRAGLEAMRYDPSVFETALVQRFAEAQNARIDALLAGDT